MAGRYVILVFNEFSYFDWHQILWFCLEEVIDESLETNQIDDIGKKFVEKFDQLFGCFNLIEICKWHKQCNGPWFILIRKCDHHKFAAWPNVQEIDFHLKLKWDFMNRKCGDKSTMECHWHVSNDEADWIPGHPKVECIIRYSHDRYTFDWNRNLASGSYDVALYWTLHHNQLSNHRLPLPFQFHPFFHCFAMNSMSFMRIKISNFLSHQIISTYWWNVSCKLRSFADTNFWLKYKWMFEYRSASVTITTTKKNAKTLGYNG